MKLWIILLLAGKVGGVWGPLPYDHEECWRRAIEGNQELWAASQNYTGPVVIENVRQDNSFYVCLQSDVRPTLNIEGKP